MVLRGGYKTNFAGGWFDVLQGVGNISRQFTRKGYRKNRARGL